MGPKAVLRPLPIGDGGYKIWFMFEFIPHGGSLKLLGDSLKERGQVQLGVN